MVHKDTTTHSFYGLYENEDGSIWITRVPDTVFRTSECFGDAIRGKKFWNHADHVSKGLSWQSFTMTHFDVEQRFIVHRTEASKVRTYRPMPGFRSFRSATKTIAGIEIMHMIRKGQMADSQHLTRAEQFYSLAG